MFIEARNIFKRSLSVIALGILLCTLAACSGDGEPAVPSSGGLSPLKLSALVDRVVADPGDIITFTLRAEYRPDISLELPDIADRLSEFRIATSSFSQPAHKADYLVVERSYKIQADISGSYVIEPIEVTYSIPGGEQQVAKTPKIFIEIESMLAKEGEAEDIRDIKPPLTISYLYRLVYIALAILCGCVLLFLLIRLFVAWRRRRAEPQKARPRPAHEEALEALDMLLNKRLVEKGRMRKFCFELSMIFRRYLQERFSIPAIDLTTEEIIPRVEENGIFEEDLRSLVKEFLIETDVVKFARYKPTMEEIEKVLRYTRTFIERTRVAPAIETRNAKDGERP